MAAQLRKKFYPLIPWVLLVWRMVGQPQRLQERRTEQLFGEFAASRTGTPSTARVPHFFLNFIFFS